MPIFQDPDRQQYYDLFSGDHRHHHHHNHHHHHHPQTLDDERQRHYDGKCTWPNHHEGRHLDPSAIGGGFGGASPSSDLSSSGLHTHDRKELIRYIKSTEFSMWSRNHLAGDSSAGHSESHASKEAPATHDNTDGKLAQNNPPSSCEQQLASPAEIQRPRSALHSGDFREGTPPQSLPQSPLPASHGDVSHRLHLSSSPTTSWFTTPSSPPPPPARRQTTSVHSTEAKAIPNARSRAPSLGSFSSSYVLKAPTSPLVHQANNPDLDFSLRMEAVEQPELLEKASRRRTLPPETFRDLQSSPRSYRGMTDLHFGFSSNRWNEPLSFQRSHTSPLSLQLASSVQTPSPRARRPSLAFEKSSKPHAPMVGSYEESILRGRMSTNPSKPLDFTAQIGVLGKGKCKANLKCPPHVTIPFPAVFYSYPTSGSGRSISDDNPSPYVGLIDLDNSLPKETSNTNRRRRRHNSPSSIYGDQAVESGPTSRNNDQETLRRREKRHRRVESPKSPPGGCYRIPQQGQLQIIIKNPNKTAVKLFLVPYDLSDMEPGTKTFIRQRSYSAGPIIDMPLSARKNYGTDRPEASLNATGDPQDRPILRYMIHLNICSPSRGRYYLHSIIRVVFANRVPDGKEKLRNEIQLPDPRYTPYKPSQAQSSSERASQKCAAGQGPAPGMGPFSSASNLGANNSSSQATHPFQPIPSLRGESLPTNEAAASGERGSTSDIYNKLSKEDAGYGGHPFGPNSGREAGESLLAKRLRGLDVQRQDSRYIN